MGKFVDSRIHITYEDKIEGVLKSDEVVYLREQPNKEAFIWSAVFDMMPFALIWLLFDSVFIIAFFAIGNIPLFVYFVFIPFILIHMTPVWIWLSQIIKAVCGYKNQEYVLTDKRIIIKSGIKKIKITSVYYSDVTDVEIRIKKSNKHSAGDVRVKLGGYGLILSSLERPLEVIEAIRSLMKNQKPDIIPLTFEEEEVSILAKKVRCKDISIKDKRDKAVDNILDNK